MSIYTYDRINLVDLSAKIISFAKTHTPNEEHKAISKCTSYNGILDYLFGEIETIKGEKRNLMKFSSGNVSVSSLMWLYKLLNPVNKNDREAAKEFKPKIMLKCSELELSIKSSSNNAGETCNGQMFLEYLMKEADRIYFMDDEYKELQANYDAEIEKKDVSVDNNFIGNLFFHAFRCVAYNLPYYVSQRIFHEALTLSEKNPMRLKLLKYAADNQNGYAALMYANAIYNENAAIDYFLIAGGFKDDANKFSTGKPRQMLSQSNALWEIGFMLETHAISESQIDYIDRYIDIKNRINQVINNYDRSIIDFRNNCMYDGYKYTDNEWKTILKYTDDKPVGYALMLYIYITMTDLTFPKAFNSIGKIILGDYLDPKAEYPSQKIDPNRLATAKKYLKIAVRLGNTNAMVNLAVYYYRTSKYNKSGVSKLELDEMRKYFEKAAALEESEAQHCLGEMLLTENRFDEACALLKTAADKNDRHACHSIGKAYISAMKTEEGERYLEKAISLRCYDAAYDLAWLYLVKKAITDPDSKAVYIQYGIRLLQDNYPNMSDEYKAKSKDLLDGLGISI